MVTVRVCSRSTGRQLRGRRVALSFDGLLRGMAGPEYSGDDGEADFDNEPGPGTVFVDGASVHRGRLAGRVVVYV